MKPAELRKLAVLLEAFSKELERQAPMAFQVSHQIYRAKEIVKDATEKWSKK